MDKRPAMDETDVSSAKRQRCLVTEDHKNILLRYYNSGMTSEGKKTHSLHLKASEETGLPLRTVKGWVGTHRKSLKKNTCPCPTNPVPRQVRPLNCYQLFCHQTKVPDQVKSLGDRNQFWKEKYNQLTLPQRNNLKKEAQRMRLGVPQTVEEKDMMRKRYLRQLERAIDGLKDLGGIEMFALWFNPSDDGLYQQGTERGMAFVNAKNIPALFLTALNEEVPEDRKQLVMQVTDIYNAKFREAGGKGEHVPYKRIREDPGYMTCHGLPDGLILQQPSNYGMAKLQKILEAKDSISFVICERPNVDTDRETMAVRLITSTQEQHGNAQAVLEQINHEVGVATDTVQSLQDGSTHLETALEDDEFEVEKIISQRKCKTHKKKKEFKVKWADYDETSWVPEEDISPELVKAFISAKKQRKNKKVTR